MLYVLDEPTPGPHFADIRRLLHVLRRPIDPDNGVVIEHTKDVITTSSSTSLPTAATPAAASSPRARPSALPR